MTTAKGPFDVQMDPQPPYDAASGVTLSRAALRKTFQGDLNATSTAEMTSAVTAIKGSAGYVAIERVVGTLQGKKGSFVLQHSGTMTRGKPELSVTVVPDSGSDDLHGLAGKMQIDIVDGKHFYTFAYTFETQD
jgi:hypothetical protein